MLLYVINKKENAVPWLFSEGMAKLEWQAGLQKEEPMGMGQGQEIESHAVSRPGSPLTCGVAGQGSECGDLHREVVGGDRLPSMRCGLSTQASGQETTPLPVLPD